MSEDSIGQASPHAISRQMLFQADAVERAGRLLT